MAGPVPAIPIISALCPPIEIAGTSLAMTNRLPRVLPLLHENKAHVGPFRVRTA